MPRMPLDPHLANPVGHRIHRTGELEHSQSATGPVRFEDAVLLREVAMSRGLEKKQKGLDDGFVRDDASVASADGDQVCHPQR